MALIPVISSMTETLQIHPVVMSQATKKQHRLSMLCSKATVSVMMALCTGKIRAFWYLVMTLLACWLLALLLIFRFCASVYSLRPRRLALLRVITMGVDWDLHLLSPLHGVFGDEHEYRPKVGAPFTINGIFDRGYSQVDENLDGDSVINTSSPMLGVRDAEFRRLGKPQPEVSDRVFIKTVGGHVINQLFVVSNINPDSHGGSRLVLNVVKSR